VKRTIAADDVPRVFDAACISALAEIAKLPPGANVKRFAEAVREAARIYAIDGCRPTDNLLRAEITKLNGAVERLARLKRNRAVQYARIADLVRGISPAARDYLSKQVVGVSLPAPAALSDPARRDEACAAIARLCQHGGHWAQGRRRQSGRRSWTWKPLLRAPTPRRHFQKREAERWFVSMLSAAWLAAAGELPSNTAHHDKPGPSHGSSSNAFYLWACGPMPLRSSMGSKNGGRI
jgi:hypothetical protein